jgi:hypothetical protein
LFTHVTVVPGSIVTEFGSSELPMLMVTGAPASAAANPGLSEKRRKAKAAIHALVRSGRSGRLPLSVLVGAFTVLLSIIAIKVWVGGSWDSRAKGPSGPHPPSSNRRRLAARPRHHLTDMSVIIPAIAFAVALRRVRKTSSRPCEAPLAYSDA